MIIILEGNELTFKSTVAKKLSEELDYKVVQGSSFEIAKMSNNDMFEHMKNLITNEDNIIIDRYMYSNLVYAELYPNNTILDKEQVEYLENLMLMSDDILIVYLYADVSILEDRMIVRGDEHIKLDELGAINSKYDEILHNSNVNHLIMKIDTAKTNPLNIVQKVVCHVGSDDKWYC